MTKTKLSIGDKAPDFSADCTNGKTVSVKDFKGSWLVLYFYPKSFTPGCTKESCNLRDGFSQIRDCGAEILGVSVDKLETQKKFKQKYNLPFELLDDHSKKISKAYNALNFTGLFSARVTYLINPQGKIAHVFKKVNTSNHNQEVLEKLTHLKENKSN